MRNIELLQQTMQFIKDNPERHNQDFWGIQDNDDACGTTACFAGWAILLSGQARLNDFEEFVAKDGRVVPPPREYAAKLLGLSWEESATMFLDADTPEELELMVKDLVNGDKLRDIKEYREEARV